MFYVLQDESTAARRRVPILLTDAATGTTAQTGVATTTIFPYVNINGGAFSSGAGTIGEAGFGQYYYEMDPSEVATLGLAGIHITAAGCRDYDAIAQVAAFNLYAAGSGISAYDVWAFDYLADGVVATSAAERLEETRTNTYNIDSNTNDIGNIVWNRDPLTVGDNTTGDYYSAYLYQLGTGATGYASTGLTAGDVWTYDISSITTSGTAGSQLNTAALPSGAGISAYDVWAYTGGGPIGSQAEILYQTSQAAAAAESNTNDIGGTVWSYNVSGRTITGGTANTVTSPVTVSTASMTGIAGTVWSTDVSGYSSPSAGFDLANASSGAGLTAGDVWDFNITGFGGTGSAAVYATNTNFTVGNIETYVASQTPQDVWTYAGIEGRTITGGLADTVTSLTNPANITTGSMTGIAGTVWSAATRTITGGTATTVTNPVDITTASMSGVAGTVWNSLVASYSTNGTFGKNILRADAANKVGDVTLYSAGGVNGVDADIHRIQNDTAAATALKDILTGVGSTITGNITGNLSGSVGSVTTDVNVAETSMSGIANTVWATDVSLYASPSAGYDLSNATAGGGITAGDVWNYVLSDSNTAEADLVQAAAGSGISAADVWTYGNRQITGGIADTVVFPVTVTDASIDDIAFAVWSNNTATYETSNSALGIIAATQNYSAYTYDVMQGIGATIWNYGTRTLTAGGAGISAADVWTYGSRTITGGIADTVTTLTNRSGFAITGGTITTVSDKTGYSLSGTQAFNLTGNITGNLSGSVGSVAGNVSGSVASVVGNLGGNVVGNVNGTVQSIVQDVSLSVGTYGDIAEYVWIEPVRTITGGVATTVGNVTGNVEGSILGNVLGNVSGSVNTVTNPVSVATASMTGIAGTVWNYGTRTLTSGGSGISAGDVWNYVLSDSNTAGADLVTAASGAGISAGDVWTYGSRTITGGIADTVTTLTNKSGFAITGGTITTVSDKTGYSLSGSQSFNLTGNITGNLSGSVGSVSTGVTVSTNNDKTGYALSTAGVSAVQSGLSTLTQAQVGTEVDSSLADVGLTTTVTGRIDATVSSRLASASYTAPPTEAAIAGTVWGYSPRTLTSGAGATAGDVWNYPTRSLTSGAGITVNAATNIINGPYFVKSNVDGQDGTLDVIRGMVQDIQLTVTDAFSNPFDTSALGLLVNFYDQAGTLTTSYATTELYGPAGLVQFTLDTAVTANEGRYNLILSAAGSGNTIKFGPLQTLVRPY